MTAPVIPTLIFRDTFTAADGTLITARSPDVGSNWTKIDGGSLYVYSNKARETSNNSWPRYTAPFTPSPSKAYNLRAVFTAPASFTDSEYFLSVTPNAAAPFYPPYQLHIKAYSGGPIRLLATVNLTNYGGPYAQSSAVDDFVSAGGSFQVDIIVDGPECWFLLNGTEVFYHNDTGNTAPSPSKVLIEPNAVSGAWFPLDSVEVYTGTPAYIPTASGFSSTTLGSPTGKFDQVGAATGAVSTAFGTPFLPLPQTGTATGFLTGTHGSHTALYAEPLTDVATSAEVLMKFLQLGSTPHADPLAAYSTWATELGFGAGTSLAFQDDDIELLNLGFAVLDGSTETRILLSSEGGVGLYYAVPASVTRVGAVAISASAPQTSITRFYSTTSRPSVVVSAKIPTIDAGRWNAKWQASGNNALLYVRWASYTNQNTNPVEAAFRFSPGRVEVVVRSLAAGGKFQVFRFNQTLASDTAVLGGGATTNDLVTNTTTHFLSEIPAVVYQASGAAPSTQFGTALGYNVDQYGQASGLWNYARWGYPLVPIPGSIVDVETGVALMPLIAAKPSTTHASALAAYNAWKTEVSAGADATLNGSDYTDGSFQIAAQTSIFNLGYPWIWISSEAGISLYREAPLFSTPISKVITASDGQVSFTGFWQPNHASALVISFGPPTTPYKMLAGGVHSNGDGWNLMRMRWGPETPGAGPIVDVAIRLKGTAFAAVVEVDNTAGATPYFQVLRLPSNLGNGSPVSTQSGGGALTETLALSSVTEYTTEVGDVIAEPTGWLATQFGTPAKLGVAAGIGPTMFGTASGRSAFHASWSPDLGYETLFAQFGTPATPVPQTASVSGFAPATFGGAVAERTALYGFSFTCGAHGWAAATFGAPNAAWPQAEDASGVTQTQFGSAAAVAGQGAQGFVVSTVGTPSGAAVMRAGTIAPTTQFGAAASSRSDPATSIGRVTRFGLPRARMLRYIASGFKATRGFGRPTGHSRFYFSAAGFTSSALGDPIGIDIHHATFQAPSTRFGRPLLTRSTTC